MKLTLSSASANCLSASEIRTRHNFSKLREQPEKIKVKKYMHFRVQTDSFAILFIGNLEVLINTEMDLRDDILFSKLAGLDYHLHLKQVGPPFHLRQLEGLTQCGAGKKTACRFMSNTFLQSSKESWCIIFAP